MLFKYTTIKLFYTFTEDSLIHLDPHVCHDLVTQEARTGSINFETFHCGSPRKLPISKMDPSATFGFYCKTHQDFLRLMQEVPSVSKI